jgi:hypothetical protein
MKFINYQEEIENWLSSNGIVKFIPLSKDESFKDFIRSHFSGIPEDVLIKSIHNCAIALGQDDVSSYSGCLATALTAAVKGELQ